MARKPTRTTQPSARPDSAASSSSSTDSAGRKRKPPRLGRGLQSLMTGAAATEPVAVADPASTAAAPTATPTHGPPPSEPGDQTIAGQGVALFHVELDRISPNPHQPRQRWDDASLDGLAASIREQGVMQPIVVRPAGPTDPGDSPDPRYQIVAGERRWRAARRAGLTAVPALLRTLSDEESAEWALVENVQREDLNVMDRAEAIQSLVEQFRLTHADIADRLGLQRATVTNLTRLLSLAPPVREMVRDDLMSMGHARALAGLDDTQHQVALAERTVREGLSVRQVEAAVRAFHVEPSATLAPPPTAPPAHLTELERDIADRLGLRVRLRTGRKKGTGSLEIKFASLEDFDSLLAKLGLDAAALGN